VRWAISNASNRMAPMGGSEGPKDAWPQGGRGLQAYCAAWPQQAMDFRRVLLLPSTAAEQRNRCVTTGTALHVLRENQEPPPVYLINLAGHGRDDPDSIRPTGASARVVRRRRRPVASYSSGGDFNDLRLSGRLRRSVPTDGSHPHDGESWQEDLLALRRDPDGGPTPMPQ